MDGQQQLLLLPFVVRRGAARVASGELSLYLEQLDADAAQMWRGYASGNEALTLALLSMRTRAAATAPESDKERRYYWERAERRFERSELSAWTARARDLPAHRAAMLRDAINAVMPLKSDLAAGDLVCYASSAPFREDAATTRLARAAAQCTGESEWSRHCRLFGDVVMLMRVRRDVALPGLEEYTSHRFIARSMLSIVDGSYGGSAALLHAFAAASAADAWGTVCTVVRPMQQMRRVLLEQLPPDVFTERPPGQERPDFDGDEAPLFIATRRLAEFFFTRLCGRFKLQDADGSQRPPASTTEFCSSK
jgi:hypothetical protein